MEINETIVRFMESSLFKNDLLTAHEPGICKPLEINETIVRFMGSSLFLSDLHTAHEPPPERGFATRSGAGCWGAWGLTGRVRPAVAAADCKSAPRTRRFMGSRFEDITRAVSCAS